jgi:hypothetical protein
MAPRPRSTLLRGAMVLAAVVRNLAIGRSN